MSLLRHGSAALAFACLFADLSAQIVSLSLTTELHVPSAAVPERSQSAQGASPGTLHLADAKNSATGAAWAEASAVVAPGTLKARIRGAASDTGAASTDSVSSSASAELHYRDTLVLAGAPLGTAATFTARFAVDLALATEADGVAWGGAALSFVPTRASFQVGDGGAEYALAFASFADGTRLVDSSFPESGWLSVSTPVVFGVPFDLTLDLETSATAYGLSILGVPGRGAFDLDLSRSLYWGGVDGVVDANGNSLAYTLLSESGIDYTRSFVPSTAVPEPTTYGALGAGLLALLVLGRRRRV